MIDGYFEYFMPTWYIVGPFGVICGHLVFFLRFGKFYQEKSGIPEFVGTSEQDKPR
jgi:hypothetical protein